jgi:hypothetical protein
MLLVLDDGISGPVACTAGPWQRLLARLRAGRLDGDLARGASPDASIGLALRAQALLGSRVRHDVAHGAQRILETTAGRRMAVPVCRGRVSECSAEIGELISRLEGPGPVTAQGVAKAKALITDGRSPLYYWASADDLRATLRSAVDALSPL